MKLFWGVKDIDKSKVSMWDPSYIGEPVMDEKFDLTPVEAQQSLIDFCDKLPDLDFVEAGKATCWTTAFRAYLKNSNLDMPIKDPDVFKTKLNDWVSTTQAGQLAKFSNEVGFIDNKLAYMKVTAQSVGNSRDPYDVKNPIYLKWENLVAEYNKNAPASMKSLEQTAG